MFTLQSNLLSQTSLQGSPDQARDLLSVIGQCAAPLEHRGPVYLTKPDDRASDMGGFQTPQAMREQRLGPSRPPWQNLPFNPAPYIPFPDFGNPAWFQNVEELNQFLFFGRDPALNVPGRLHAGIVGAGAVIARRLQAGGIMINGQNFIPVKGAVMDVYVSGSSMKVKKSEGYVLMTADRTTETTIC